MTNKTYLIIGAGLAGLTTALASADKIHVDKVILFEKAKIGGNSMRATSGINSLNNADTEKRNCFINDVLKSSNSGFHRPLIETLVDNSQSALEWLSTKGLTMGGPRRLGGHSEPRSYRVLDATTGKPRHIGSSIITTLKQLCIDHPKIQINEGCQVKKLLSANQKITGIEYISTDSNDVKKIYGDRIILTTGGFSSNQGLLQEVNPSYAKLGTTNGSYASGDGLTLGSEVGGKLTGMSNIQLHPTGFVNLDKPDAKEQILAPEILRSLGGVLVSRQGLRFTRELGTRKEIVDDIYKNNDHLTSNFDKPVSFLLVDQKIVKDFGADLFSFYLKQGLFHQCNSINAIAEFLENPEAKGNLVVTLKHLKFEAPYYIAVVSPVIHYTMGGLEINSKAQVLDANNQPIQGLYAAGEVTGGIHGENRLAGNSLLECVVFGRIAASD